MYIDIEANDNLEEDAMATFAVIGDAGQLTRIRLWRCDAWVWCAITGWSEAGPVTARIMPIEESGDGPALLVTGGDWGLRLAALPDEAAPMPRWDLDDTTQWAEPFLICRPDISYR